MNGEDSWLDRRALLAAAAAATIMTGMASRSVAAEMSLKRFPPGFRWGAATAAHQIEGNDTNSDLWFLENTKPTTFRVLSSLDGPCSARVKLG